jgi:hypothetical protein
MANNDSLFILDALAQTSPSEETTYPLNGPTHQLRLPLSRYREIGDKYKPDGPWKFARMAILDLVEHVQALENGARGGEIARLEHELWLRKEELRDVRGQMKELDQLYQAVCNERDRFRKTLIAMAKPLAEVVKDL